MHEQFLDLLHYDLQIVLRARTHYDVWWEYVSAEARPTHQGFRDEFPDFAELDSHAHFMGAIVGLATLLETRSDTRNLASLLRDAELAGLDQSAIDCARATLQDLSDVAQKIAILRSAAIAHRSSKLRNSDVFEKADLTPFGIRDASDGCLAIVNRLLEACGQATWVFPFSPKRQFLELSSRFSS